MRGKAGDDRDVVGHPRCAPVRQHRELVFGAGIHTPAQQRVAGLQHVVERAAPPGIGRLYIQRNAKPDAFINDRVRTPRGSGKVAGPLHEVTDATGRVDALQACATIFVHSGFVRAVAPAEQAAFVDRMERVDKHVGATKRNPGRDATVAEPGDNASLRRAGQAGLGQPC